MRKNKTEIAADLKEAFETVTSYCKDMDSDVYFRSQESKWNIAENIHHLILSTVPLSKAMYYPKLVIRLVAGKGSGSSMEYEALTGAYQSKLDQGGVATGDYVPKGRKKFNQEQSLKKLSSEGQKLVHSLDRWTEEQLDNYRLPHPLLGKITVREMLYFTIYHTHHHLSAIKNIS